MSQPHYVEKPSNPEDLIGLNITDTDSDEIVTVIDLIEGRTGKKYFICERNEGFIYLQREDNLDNPFYYD